jgi:hypothetical protein
VNRRPAVDEQRELARRAERLEHLRAHEHAARAEIARGRFDLELARDVEQVQLDREPLVAAAVERIVVELRRRGGAESAPAVVTRRALVVVVAHRGAAARAALVRRQRRRHCDRDFRRRDARVRDARVRRELGEV